MELVGAGFVSARLDCTWAEEFGRMWAAGADSWEGASAGRAVQHIEEAEAVDTWELASGNLNE